MYEMIRNTIKDMIDMKITKEYIEGMAEGAMEEIYSCDIDDIIAEEVSDIIDDYIHDTVMDLARECARERATELLEDID